MPAFLSYRGPEIMSRRRALIPLPLWRSLAPTHRTGAFAAGDITEETMDAMERRVFLKGAGLGLIAFTVDGASVLMTPGEARAQGVPFRLLKAKEAETIEALGETLVPGAQHAGIAHFINQQVSVPPGEALLEARQLNVKPPFVNFYRAAIGAVDKASEARNGRRFVALSTTDQHDFVDLMRQNKIEGWQGPAGGFVYFVLRSDAVDVVYGTMDGYESLGVPYMPHIAPEKRW
jgi:Gluconate 2-dehydrogenase subunit 3